MGFLDWTIRKFSPAQQYISGGGTKEASSAEPTMSYQLCYERLEVVNRAVNMIVDDTAEIKCVVGDQIAGLTPFVKGVKKVQLNRLLNKEPNPFQDINSFRRALLMDFILDGNIFIYWDGAYMYHLPATRMKVVSDAKTFISHYEYDGGEIKYGTDEVIHIMDNNYQSLFRGGSRLKPALRTMSLLMNMRDFQDNFFKNGAVPGLVLKTENSLNERHKQRLQDEWAARYRPTSGGKRPIILDGGMEVDAISAVSFKDLDFQNAITENKKIVLEALGIPPVLMDSGNNANLRPNHRLYYLETILPIVSKMNSAFERFFGFEVYEDITYIHAMRPELRDEAAYWSTLVNTGIVAPNEARDALGLKTIAGHDDLRIPQNIAGSAANPSEGGRPTAGDEE